MKEIKLSLRDHPQYKAHLAAQRKRLAALKKTLQEMDELAKIREAMPWHPDSVVVREGL